MFAAAQVGAAQAQVTPPMPPADNAWSAGAELLVGWSRKSPTPVPIITTSYVDAPDNRVLLGGGSVDTNPDAGLRLTGAYRFNARTSVEAVAFYLPQRTTTSSVNSSGEPGSIDLFLPYFNVNTGHEDVTEISHWPDYRGSAQAQLENDLGGGELDIAWTLPPRNGWRVDLLGGARFLQLRERYTISTSSPYNPPNPADIWTTNDTFDARNRFLGVQGGVRAIHEADQWTATVSGKLALGAMQQRVAVDGSLVTNDYNDYGATQTFAGGYFALPTNSGVHTRTVFAAVPEVAFNLGYRVAPGFTVFAAYSFLYASSVVRPGAQISRAINPTQAVAYGNDPPAALDGLAQPTFGFDTSSFWIQTVSIGASYRF